VASLLQSKHPDGYKGHVERYEVGLSRQVRFHDLDSVVWMMEGR